MTTPDIDIAHLKTWIGKTQSLEEVISAYPMRALSATIDRDDPLPDEGTILPPSAHWLHFLETPIHRELDSDGHAKKGGFLPPVPLPRRMWAGGRIWMHRPLRVGDRAVRRSRVLDVSVKKGQTGTLVFVLVQHRIQVAGADVLVEEHDIVYREEADPNAPPPPPKSAPAEAAWHREVVPDEAMLFRYSALIFNAHRIHYDLPFVQEEEGYPGLIVHGPLTATLLMDLCSRESDRPLIHFDYRAVAPAFADGKAMSIQAAPEADERFAKVWALDSSGHMVMQAKAVFAGSPA